MADDVARFYDDLSNHYHLLLEDWERSLDWQAELLDGLITDRLGPGAKRILDPACGIGTQALGLARRGHDIAGSDLSAAAVARAKREAKARELGLSLTVADMRSLSGYHAGLFDAVCIMDNSLTHLRNDADLILTLQECAALLRPEGLFLASLRDYDALLESRPKVTEPKVFDDKDGRRVVFQVWDWRGDGAGYRVHQYILRQRSKSGPVEPLLFTTDYWCLTRKRLSDLLAAAGLTQVEWLDPEATGFYQPMVAARAVAPVKSCG